jgi:uncharacterized Zn finger protein (UPF0148 family)
MSSTQSCDECGQPLRPGARFCPECGRPTPVRTAPSRPPSAPPPNSPGYVPTSTWPAQPAADRVPDDDPPSLFSRPPSPPARRSGPPRQEQPKRSQWLLVAALAAVVVGVGAGIALVALPSHHRPASIADTALNSATAEPSSAAAAPAASSASSAASSSVSSPAPASPEQTAQALSALLTQSGTDRQAVDNAATAVENCSGDLSQDETTFSQAAAARQTLLSQLAALPGSSSLSAPMLQDLTTAWQASAEADQDFVQWTQDEIAQGCSTNDQADPAFVAATAPDDAATKYKKAFAALWAPVASQYGLPAYQFNQI